HVTLKAIANNAEIDVIWEDYEAKLAPVREQLTKAIGPAWVAKYRKGKRYDVELPETIQEWEVPREFPADWPETAKRLHEEFWNLRIARQKAIDASIAAKAEFEYLYDKPYEDKSIVRVAGPFTVESLSPHRSLTVDENGELIDPLDSLREPPRNGVLQSFEQMVLENLRVAGVQQAHKEDKIDFTSLRPWPG